MKFLFALVLCFAPFALHTEEVYHLKIEVDLICPDSEELQVLIEKFKRESGVEENYNVWVDWVVDGMDKLKDLLDSGNIYEGLVKADHELEKE